MAGSEQVGIDGARADLFSGAVWVLTPDEQTDGDAYVAVRTVVAGFGAEVLAVPADHHDALVAVVSHVPHLTAATLMSLADTRSTRAPGAAAPRRRRVPRHDPHRRGRSRDLARHLRGEQRRHHLGARHPDRPAGPGAGPGGRPRPGSGLVEPARRPPNGPGGPCPPARPRPSRCRWCGCPIPDRTGELARVLTSASELGVNVFDLEIAHSAEGDEGVAILVVASETAEALRAGLAERGYHPSVDPLE